MENTKKPTKEIDEELQKFYIENGCNETFERSQYRLMISFVFTILSTFTIICHKIGKVFPYHNVINFVFIFISISQLLQGKFQVWGVAYGGLWFDKKGKAKPVTNPVFRSKMINKLNLIYLSTTLISGVIVYLL